MVENKTLIGVITVDHVRRPDFYDYFNQMDKPKNAIIAFNHDRSPAHGRNQLIDAAKENDCTHILFIDDDMALKPNSMMTILEHDKDIISGLYLSRAYPHIPLAFDLADEDGSACPMYLMGIEPRLTPIVAAGFGFLLVKMSVFDKLTKPYVRLGELDAEQWCDDIGFFKRVREAKIESFCDMNVPVGHMGNMIIWPNKVSGKWMTGYDTGGTGMLNTPQINPDVAYAFKKE